MEVGGLDYKNCLLKVSCSMSPVDVLCCAFGQTVNDGKEEANYVTCSGQQYFSSAGRSH